MKINQQQNLYIVSLISSTILGQHGTPAPGIAPLCTALNIAISFAGDDFISPFNLTHAINTALQWGANIIHIAACHPTRQKGTSCSAPIVTGISALLMSLQLQRGEQPNAEAVREAILRGGRGRQHPPPRSQFPNKLIPPDGSCFTNQGVDIFGRL